MKIDGLNTFVEREFAAGFAAALDGAEVDAAGLTGWGAEGRGAIVGAMNGVGVGATAARGGVGAGASSGKAMASTKAGMGGAVWAAVGWAGVGATGELTPTFDASHGGCVAAGTLSSLRGAAAADTFSKCLEATRVGLGTGHGPIAITSSPTLTQSSTLKGPAASNGGGSSSCIR